MSDAGKELNKLIDEKLMETPKNASDEEVLFKLYNILSCSEKLHYTILYDLLMKEIEQLREPNEDSYRTVKALAACYELQEYSASKLARFSDETDC